MPQDILNIDSVYSTYLNDGYVNITGCQYSTFTNWGYGSRMYDDSCQHGTTQSLLNGIKIMSHIYFLIFMIFNEWKNKNFKADLYYELDRNFTLSLFRVL